MVSPLPAVVVLLHVFVLISPVPCYDTSLLRYPLLPVAASFPHNCYRIPSYLLRRFFFTYFLCLAAPRRVFILVLMIWQLRRGCSAALLRPEGEGAEGDDLALRRLRFWRGIM